MTNRSTPRMTAMWTSFVERSETSVGPTSKLGVGNFYSQPEIRARTSQSQKTTQLCPLPNSIKQSTRKGPKVFDGKLNSDFATWTMDVENNFEYYHQEFTNDKDTIFSVRPILEEKSQRCTKAE
jgi:hypothetical protein